MVPAGEVPQPGEDPKRFPQGRFYLVNLRPGEGREERPSPRRHPPAPLRRAGFVHAGQVTDMSGCCLLGGRTVKAAVVACATIVLVAAVDYAELAGLVGLRGFFLVASANDGAARAEQWGRHLVPGRIRSVEEVGVPDQAPNLLHVVGDPAAHHAPAVPPVGRAPIRHKVIVPIGSTVLR